MSNSIPSNQESNQKPVQENGEYKIPLSIQIRELQDRVSSAENMISTLQRVIEKLTVIVGIED